MSRESQTWKELRAMKKEIAKKVNEVMLMESEYNRKLEEFRSDCKHREVTHYIFKTRNDGLKQEYFCDRCHLKMSACQTRYSNIKNEEY